MGRPLPLSGLVVRVLGALASVALVSVALLALFASLALAIEWDIPEPTELLGPSSVFDRDGVPLARFAAEVERIPVPLDAMAAHVRNAVVATEDHRFYEHRGVDALAVLRAVYNNLRTGHVREGGSTLTQQYVKNTYVGDEVTLYRKIREAVVAVQLEKIRSKDEILEAYLNRVYFGEGAYGVEAAARVYFGKHAGELDLAESATLASTLAAPTRFSPRADPEGARRRRDIVLGEMARYGFITPEASAAARAQPIVLAPIERGPRAVPYFVEEVRRQLLEAYGAELVYNGGLAVRTTLDVDRQTALDRVVATRLPADPRYDAGVAAVDPATGDVLAAWSGRSYAASQVDLALRQDYGRPSGSTFKIFALAAGLEEGRTLDDRYPAPARVRIADWAPRGSGGCPSPCSLLEATVRSANTVFAQLGRDVGVADFTAMAERMGVRSTLREHDLTQVLGTASVTPLDLASAAATLANDGVACPARVILEVTDAHGRPLPAPDPRQPSAADRAAWADKMRAEGFDLGPEDLGRCYRALAPSVARTVTVALEQAVARGTGTRAQIGRAQAGKTGTTSDSTEVWFVGYTPQLALSVFFGARDAAVPLQGVAGCRRQCFGGELPAEIWRDAAAALLEGVAPAAFPAPGDDERVFPDRRRLGPRGGGASVPDPAPSRTSPSPDADGTATPSPHPTQSDPQPTTRPGPSRSPTPGIIPPLLPDPT